MLQQGYYYALFYFQSHWKTIDKLYFSLLVISSLEWVSLSLFQYYAQDKLHIIILEHPIRP